MLTRMSTLQGSLSLMAGALLLLGSEPAWKTKATPAWTEQDAREILTNSAWARTIEAAIRPFQTEDERRQGGNMGQERGIGFDGIADDRPRVQPPKRVIDIVKPESVAPAITKSLQLQLRWESALPVRIAEMKCPSAVAASLEGDGYMLAVYGIPDLHFKGGNPKVLGNPLKSQAVLKRFGKKDVKPSSAELFQGQNGLVVVYVFPLSAEITKNDGRIEFSAQIGRIAIAQTFDLDEMQFRGKLEL